jgi:hypothetical protein
MPSRSVHPASWSLMPRCSRRPCWGCCQSPKRQACSPQLRGVATISPGTWWMRPSGRPAEEPDRPRELWYDGVPVRPGKGRPHAQAVADILRDASADYE